MKILIWAPFLNKVGTTTNVTNSILALKKYSKNLKCSIDLVNVFGEWDNSNLNHANIKIINFLKNKSILNANKKGFLRSRFYTLIIIFISLFPLLRLIKKNNYDFVISHLITSLPILLFSLIKTKTKLILSISGFPKLTKLRTLFWKFSQKNIFKIICPSYETKNLLLTNKIFRSDQLVVIKDPHIISKKFLNKKNSTLIDFPLKQEKFLISIGRLTRQKNFLFLIEAFKNILKIRNDLHLLIIGEGEDRKKIEKKIKDYELTHKVHLIGYQDNIYKYLKNAFCYVSTSLWEGPDLAMLDAAYLNIPIICSNCKSGRKEFISEGQRGYIFETNSMNAFLTEFKKFIEENDIDLKKKLINSKKEVKNFTMFRYYKDIKNILQQ